jgi:uncharacterized membrane protein
MGIKRIGRHLLLSRWRVRRAFPRASLAAIEKAIEASELQHNAQLRFVVEGALDGEPLFADQSSRARAIDIFSRLRIWDTEHNSGVLIYLLLADRRVEIVADRGINAKVDDAEWDSICRDMETEFARNNFTEGALQGINAITRILSAHYPSSGPHKNELPDKPILL